MNKNRSLIFCYQQWLPQWQAAVPAGHLNMLEEAEQLLLGCGRHDLLNKLYQDR